MKIKSFVLGAALLSAAGLSTPALSYTHHPSTAAERKQTNDLNAQQLAQAQQPMQQQAANTSSMPNATTPEQPNNAMTTTSQSNTAPTYQQNENQQGSMKQPSDESTQTPEQAPQASPQQ